MTWQVGTIYGTPVEIRASWFIAMAILAYGIGAGYIARIHTELTLDQSIGLGLVASLLLFACLLIHEFAHVAWAKRCGLRVGTVTLFLLGGAAQLKDEPDRWSSEFGVALAGPIASLACAAGCALAWWSAPPGSVWGTLTFYLAVSNVLLMVVNMLPGFPLDGGRATRAVLWRLLNNRMLATRITTISGMMIGWGAVTVGVLSILWQRDASGLWFVLVGWFVNDSAERAWEHENLRESLRGVGAADLITVCPSTVSPDATLSGALGTKPQKGSSEIWPVMDESGVMGMVTSSRAAEVPSRDWERTKVAQVMQPVKENIFAAPDEAAMDIVERLWEQNEPGALIVSDGENLLGVVDRQRLSALLHARVWEG
jgi:Zn-dependent protease/predicted transcriptional regulator